MICPENEKRTSGAGGAGDGRLANATQQATQSTIDGQQPPATTNNNNNNNDDGAQPAGASQPSRIRDEVVAYKRAVADVVEEYFSSGDVQVGDLVVIWVVIWTCS